MSEETSTLNLVAPRIAFLGFCERAETITAGHTAFWRWNLLGVSDSRSFYVFPTNLRGHKIVFAVYRPKAGDSFQLIFRCGDHASFDLTFGISSFSVAESQDGAPIKITEHGTGVAVEGWELIVEEINADVVVVAPGVYDVFWRSPDGEQHLGKTGFFHVPVPPYSPDEITAIKSDPLATKFVRLEIHCNLCGGGVKAYAGIERSPILEEQGYRWNHDILEDEFSCTCGKTRFSLAPIRTGLHGLLRRNLNPETSTNVSAVKLYEKSALEESCRQLLRLMDEKPKEEVLQQFLESHPIFFHIFIPKRITPKPHVLTKYFADFAVLNAKNELLLVEIERPGMVLLKKDGDMTSDLSHAFHQVRTWMQVFDDHRAAALDAIGLKLEQVARVKGIVIAGRIPSDERKLRMLRSVSTAQIELFTYDDILKSVTELVKHMAIM
jgi:Domain of unknown function (DUF4263)